MIPDRASPLVYVDGGTTQTRAWLARAPGGGGTGAGDEVLAEARVAVGARDTARDGSPARLARAVGELVREVLGKGAAVDASPPARVLAAGMITSPQGLCEIPHVAAPADAGALASAARTVALPELPELPVVFIPGVRSGPERADLASIGAADLMRGEEVLALGLAARGHLPAGGTLLNLGSHWKAIAVDARGAITGSVTTLSGELVHAVQSQTILASALPQERPRALEGAGLGAWLEAGARAAEASGLPRALYCVRLLEQRAQSNPDERLAFLVGAVIASDRGVLVPAARGGRVLVVGGSAVADAWAALLGREGIHAVRIDEAEVERAFRAGCRAVYDALGARGR